MPPEDKPNESTIRAWTSLMRTAASLLEKVEARFKSAGFPPLAWYDVLWELDRTSDGELPQSALQSRVLLAQYNLCRLLSRLEAQRLVERRPSPTDARSNIVVLTSHGRALRLAMWPVYANAIETHVGSRIDGREAGALTDLLGKLREASQQ